MRTIIKARSRRATLAMASVALLAGGTVAATASPASALVVIPAGCGSWSGTVLAAGWFLYDYSGGAAVGTAVTPHVVPLVANSVTVGSSSADYINGNTNVGTQIICGGGGADVIDGLAGNDDIYGGGGADTLSGGENSDFISGGPGNDTLYGDAAVPNTFDTADEIQGGDGSDDLYGGEFNDTLRGGNGGSNNDFADGGGGSGDVCTGIEQVPVDCP